MARVIVIRGLHVSLYYTEIDILDDGDYQVPESFLSSRRGLRAPVSKQAIFNMHYFVQISRRSIETGEPVDLSNFNSRSNRPAFRKRNKFLEKR